MSARGAKRTFDESVHLGNFLAQPRILGLDFLRAVAVMLVLLDHSGFEEIHGLKLFDGGLGVEIFFVLSGFLITSLLLNEQEKHGRIDLPRFYLYRAARLLPAFYLYLLTGLLILLVLGRPVPWGAVGASAVYVLNYYQALTGAVPHYLSHCWSLAVEEQFYFLWPPVLVLLFSRRVPLGRSIFALVVGAWCLRLTWIAIGAGDDYLYRALETRADHLLIGCLLAVLMRRLQWRVWTARLATCRFTLLALLLCIGLSINYLDTSIRLKYAVAFVVDPLMIGIALPVIVFMASGKGVVARFLNLSIFTTLGRVSYGMYLFHPFVMHPIQNAIERGTGSHLLAVATSIGAVVICALLSFHWFEQPVRASIRALYPRHEHALAYSGG